MKTLLFCGGGSAGHVIPNVALIEELKDEYLCVYAGTGGIEKEICNKNKIKFYEFDAVKLVRGKFFCNLLIPFKLCKSIKSAKKILDYIKPDLVFCKGGYASVPVAFAASKKHIPVLTHESDLSAGLANKIIAKKCKAVLTTFPTTAYKFKNGICVGSPMRRNLFNAKKKSDSKRKTLLVFGGGSGSKIINDNLRAIIFDICKVYDVLHICGKGNVVESSVSGYRQFEFVSDMGELYALADAAIARCGSNSANELIALKIPTLFIPLENSSSRGDQVKNAEYFENLKLCRVLKEGSLTPKTLKAEIEKLFADEKIKTALNLSKIECGNNNIIKIIKSSLR